MPLTSQPEGIFLPPEEFEARFGFAKPGVDVTAAAEGEEAEEEGDSDSFSRGATEKEKEKEKEKEAAAEDGRVREVVFYCKAGVRSRAAARLAAGEGGWKGVRIGDLGGGWMEWERRGGGVE